MSRLVVALVLLTPAAGAEDLRGVVSVQSRIFLRSGADPAQLDGGVSLAMELESRWTWDEGRQRLVAKPFVRLDSADQERSHGDLRELYWQWMGERWEVSVGVRKIYWGVTESQHLVDVINQTDLVEDIDGEEKLGQPMITAARATAAGRWELLLMPDFRERPFPGQDGRLRTTPRVDGSAQYESSDEDQHLDAALRWSARFGDWDLGLSHFSGTSRDPLLRFDPHAGSLLPFYPLMEQTGVDLQLTRDALLGKLELIRRQSDGETFEASTAGFEYTFTGVRGGAVDIGALVEHLYDSRGKAAPVPFQNDLFVGTRIALNDVQSTQLLAGAIVDLESGAAFLNVEGSRRIGSHWKINLTARDFRNVPITDPLSAFQRDSYLELEIARHF